MYPCRLAQSFEESVQRPLERFAIACTGAVARVVYSRMFPSLTTPQTERLNKSPHTVHAIANRSNFQPAPQAADRRDETADGGSQSNEVKDCDGLPDRIDRLSDRIGMRPAATHRLSSERLPNTRKTWRLLAFSARRKWRSELS